MSSKNLFGSLARGLYTSPDGLMCFAYSTLAGTLLLCFRCSTLPAAAAAAHWFLVSISRVLRLLTSVSTLLVRCTASTLASTSGANAEFK